MLIQLLPVVSIDFHIKTKQTYTACRLRPHVRNPMHDVYLLIFIVEQNLVGLVQSFRLLQSLAAQKYMTPIGSLCEKVTLFAKPEVLYITPERKTKPSFVAVFFSIAFNVIRLFCTPYTKGRPQADALDACASKRNFWQNFCGLN